MKVIAVDDEQISLDCLEVVLKSIPRINCVDTFSDYESALNFVKNHKIDIAFLDIEMKGKDGLVLASEIKEISPFSKIIFVTSTPKYAVNAFQLHANGYLVKPVKKEDIEREIDFLSKNDKIEETVLKKDDNNSSIIKKDKNQMLRIQTFGNFEVFYNDEPVKFIRSKSKELLAYLIDRKGSNCSVGELCSVLWENKIDNEALQSQLRKVISDLRKTLATVDNDDILTKSRGYIAVIPDKINCDYYNFLKKDTNSIFSFSGEYMKQYSWSEITAGYLESCTNR